MDTPADLTGRIGNAAVTLADDQNVMLFGGLSVDGLSNRFDLLDTQTRTWDTTITSQLSNILSQRQDAEMARVGQWVLVWGGENATGPLSDGVRLDLSSGYAYVATPAGPAARTRFSMTVVGDQIAIWGGEGLNGDLNDGALYDPASNTWANMATSVSIPARQGHQAFASGTELVLVGRKQWAGHGQRARLQHGHRHLERSGSVQRHRLVPCRSPRVDPPHRGHRARGQQHDEWLDDRHRSNP